jgi:type VII secretion integral membrane protein EccD
MDRGPTPATSDDAAAARFAVILRDPYLLWWRLAVRVVEAASLVALGRNPHGIGVAAAAAFAVYDVGLAVWLRRAGRDAFWARLALDTADVVAWSLAIGAPADAAVLIASPLAAEAGMRSGGRGLVVPLVVGAGTNIALLAAGWPPAIGPFLWPLIAVALAGLVSRYLLLLLDRRLRAAGDEIEAAASRARLAGQNSVAAGADSVVDVLTRTIPLLSAGGAALPPSRIPAWKQALAEASAGQASYLGVALSRWQRLRNSLSPDLVADVELPCVEGAGTLLLSPAQADALERVLDGLSLCGVETVAVPDPAPAGREQVLLVGGRRVVLPADPRVAAPSLDLGPVALLLGAASFLTQSLPRGDGVPPPVTLALAAAAVAVAWWAHRLLQRRGPAAHAAVLAAALALGAADAVLATLTMRNPTIDHLARFPFLLFLIWFGPLLILYSRDLSDRARWLLVGAAGATVATGMALLHAVPVGHVLVALVWPASTNLAGLGLRDMLARDEADAAAALERRHQAAVDVAYRQGRRLVIDLVAQAATDAWNAYFEVRRGLPETVAPEFERRLADVEARLAGLRAVEERASADLRGAAGGVEVEAMGGDVRQVTIHGAGRRVDLSLPATAPIAELVPALIRLGGVASLRGAGAFEDDTATPPAWALARVGEPALALTSSLADAGVLDGEVLYLVDVSRWRAPAVVELSATVGQAVAGGAPRWTRQGTAWVIAGLAVLTLAAAVAIAVRTGSVHDETALAALLLAFALLAAGVALRSRRDGASTQPALPVLLAGAWALAGLGGWGVAGEPVSAGGLAAAALAMGAAMLATYPVAPAVAPGAALAALSLAAAAGAAGRGASPAAAAVVVAVAGVTALRLLPRVVSLLLAGVTAGPAMPAQAELEAWARRCRQLLVSLSAGTAVATLGAVLAMLAWGDGLAVALAAVVAVALLLQARPYRFVPEILPLTLSAGVVMVAVATLLSLRVIAAGGQPLLAVAALVAMCVGLAALSAAWGRLPATPRLPPATWLLVDVALAPLALAELGVLAEVAQLVRQALR